MVQPWISVVTPSLNQGRFVGKAIDSVLGQRGVGEIEHIVVEGGSTDTTADVLRHYPQLRVLHDPGVGQSHAVNLGLEAASGDVVGWLNADDRYAPGVFARVREAFAKNAEAAIVYGNAEFIDADGTVIGRVRPGPFDVARLLHGVNPIPQPAVFIRMSLLRQIGLLDERLHYVMDYELWLRAARVTSLVWLDETWAQFRKHSQSKTVSKDYAFWPEKRAVARAYGGPFFSEAWRERTINRTYPKALLASLRHDAPPRRSKFRL